MKRDVVAECLPCIPSVSTYSRRSRTLFAGSPFVALPTSSCATSAVPSVSYQGPVECLRLSRDERSLAIAAQSVIKVFDLSTGRQQRQLPGHSLPIRAICPKRTSIYDWVSGSLDGTWAVWDMRCHPAKVLDGRASGPIRCVDVSPDDTIIAVGTDATLQLWDMRRRQTLDRFPAPTSGVMFSPTERLLASYGAERVVRFWCLDQMSCIGVSDAFSSEIRGLSFAGLHIEEDFLVACTDNELRVITYEPSDTLISASLPSAGEGQRVLELTMSDQDVALIVYGNDCSLSILSCPVEDTLTGTLEISSPVAQTVTEEEESDPIADLSPSVEVPPTVSSRPLSSASESPNSWASPSCSSSDMDGEGAPVVAGRPTLPPLPPTNGRVLRSRIGSVAQKDKNAETKTTTIQSRPRSPSESTIASSTPTPPPTATKSRSTSVSRNAVNVRSASPANRARTIPQKKTSPGESRPRGLSTARPSPTAQRKVEEKTTTIKNREGKENNDEDPDLDGFLTRFDISHSRHTVAAERRINEVQEMVRHWSVSGGLAVAREALYSDASTTALLLSALTSTKTWDLQQVGLLLPRMIDMLNDGQELAVVLESLTFICSTMVDCIRNCTKGPTLTIGVDVAAEERRECALNCSKQLIGLRESRDKLYNRLKLEDAMKLDAAISLLKHL